MALPEDGSQEVYGTVVVLGTCRLDVKLEVRDPEADDPERSDSGDRDAIGSELLVSVSAGGRSLADLWLPEEEARSLLMILDHLLYERLQAEVP